MEVIGRHIEKQRLISKLKSDKPELIAILGRRRIGKTFLIRNIYKENMVFQFTGLYQGNLPEHLNRFTKAIIEQLNTQELKVPTSWFEAFDLLKKELKKLKTKKRKVVFLDEFPWMATNKSRFLTAFTDFWNSYGSANQNLIIVICGSSASWMINKVLKNKGGLHNRVTDRLILKPFNLRETESFLRRKQIVVSREAIIKIYMALGGVPYYLDQIDKGESEVQAMDRICFAKEAVLRFEFNELFISLFDNSEKHLSIIKILNKFPKGLTRDEIISKTKLKSGGGFTSILEELEYSGFISAEIPYGKKRNDKKYQIKDNYTLFYLKYIQHSKSSGEKIWEKLSTSPSWQAWSGLAFENICMDHSLSIKKALKIEGIIASVHSWHASSTDEMKGAQVDLLLDRADGIINLCEIKFSNSPYVITSDYIKKLRLKVTSFKFFTKTRKTIFPTMITTYGLVENKHSIGFIQNELTMDDLFL